MSLSSHEFYLVVPEIWIAAMASLILIVDLYLTEKTRWITYFLSQITLIGAFYFTWVLWGQGPKTAFYETFILDNIGTLLKMVIFVFGFFVFMYSRKYLEEHNSNRGEYFVLCLFSILGMMVLVSARSFLTLYLGLELFALPLYALVAFVRVETLSRGLSQVLSHETGAEAAMKYFIMGAMASGMLLYGVSLLYGVTGSFGIAEISSFLTQETEVPLAVLFGLMFILVGLAFKFGAVPFHMWIPDVYQGAPTAVTLFISTLPKLAGFGMAIRILLDTFHALSPHWQELMIIMAILSMAVGNIAAIAQSNLKRMLAYSTIAHMGFLFLGLLAGPESGYAAALVYVIIYALMALGAFGIIIALSYRGFEFENIEDFKGLAKREPWIALMMMFILLSLTGIPPFAGFYAKFLVLNALIHAGYVWLAAVAVLFSVIGAYYYLRVIKVMFFDEPKETLPLQYQKVSKSGVALVAVNGFSVLLLGIFPAFIFDLAVSAFVR